jgi:hypothetical protein
LFEIVWNHEMPELAVGIEVLHFRLDHIRGLDSVARFERTFDNSAGLQIADFDAIEGLAFAGFDHFVFDDRIWIVFQHDLQTGLKFVRRETAHMAPPLTDARMWSRRGSRRKGRR